MRTMIVAIAAAFLVGTAGCEFTNSQQKKTEAATAADIATMRDQVARLHVAVEALDREMKRSDRTVRGEIATLQKNLNDLNAASARRLEEVKTELVKKINQIELKRINDKNALNKKMDAIVAEMRRALGPGAATSGGTRTEKGFEHTVKEGESVWAIAAKYRDQYGTTVKAILEANNLTSTSTIHPGDTLWIPVKE